jgi:NTP pyrophosphatase (non-canonical NTP hydrolase)
MLPMDSHTTLADLKHLVKTFCQKRDWDQFHGAKDLAIGVITEAAELLEHFRFKNEKEIAEMLKNKVKKEEIEDELADVLFFIIRFAQRYDIDLSKAAKRKLKKS